MTDRGRVENGVIVPDEPVTLPERAEVEVSPTSEDVSEPIRAEDPGT